MPTVTANIPGRRGLLTACNRSNRWGSYPDQRKPSASAVKGAFVAAEPRHHTKDEDPEITATSSRFKQSAMDACGARRILWLLSVSLLASVAAADCPKPRAWGVIVVTKEVLLTKNFPDGAVATVECSNGFVKVNGSATSTCVNGQWTEPDLFCTRRDCGPPRPQPHMKFDYSSGTLFRDIVDVSCDEGYLISGASHKQCFASGWVGKSECHIVTCGEPVQVNNSKHSWKSGDPPQYQDVVSYVCDDGFARVGDDNVTCNASGKYDPAPPVCQVVTCSVPAQLSGGKHSWESANAPRRGDVVRFDCDDGLSLVGRTSITCGANGSYDGEPPKCTETSTASPTPTPTPAPTDKPITGRAATTVTTPTHEGAGDNLTARDEAAAANGSTQTSLGDDLLVVDTKANGYDPVVISVVSVTIGVCFLVGVLYKFLQRKKGSYNTREDQKQLQPSTAYRLSDLQSNGTLNPEENMVV